MPSSKDALLLTIGAGISIHLFYNRIEPRKLRYHFALLGIVPAVLAVLLSSSFSSIPKTIIYVYMTFFSSLITSVVAYRLSPFHPLAKFPGPLKHRISNLAMLPVAERGKRHVYYRELHEKYGPFVRVGPNAVSVCDAGAIYPLLGTKGVPRGEVHNMFTKDENDLNMFNATNPQQHAEFRKAWHRGFTPAAMRGYDPIFAKRLGQLLECLANQQGSLDIGQWISFYKFDVMGDLVFGGGFELMKAGGDFDGHWKVLDEGMKMAGILEHIPWSGRIIQRLPLNQGSLRQIKFSEECVERRLKTGSMTHDLFYYFAEEDKPETQRPNFAQNVHHAGGAIVAAADTTVTTITGLLYHILRYPEAYKRLQAEVDSFFERGDEIIDNQSVLPQMPFLNACIEETLRVMPALPTLLQRDTPRGGDGATVAGRFIPGGTRIFLPLYALFRDRRYFSLPDTFWPDRWLYDPEDEKRAAVPVPDPFIHDTSAFVPFSFGPANCIGKQLAYKEIRLVIATLLQKFDMKFAPGYVESGVEKFIEETLDHLILVKGKLPVVLNSRS